MPFRSTSFDYVRAMYGVPAKRGGRVRVKLDVHSSYPGREGRIARATNYVWVILDGKRHSQPFHPDDLEYLSEVPA
jgi:hypothetical protein